MKDFKKIVGFLIIFCLFTCFSVQVKADEYCVDNGGCGYEECCRTSTLAPAIALGTIALVAMIAVAIQNTSGHSHCHSHSGCNCH